MNRAAFSLPFRRKTKKSSNTPTLTSSSLAFIRGLLHEQILFVLLLIFGLGTALVLWFSSILNFHLVESTALRGAELYSQALREFRTLYTSEVVDRVKSTSIKVTHAYENQEGAIPLPATLSMKLGDAIGRHRSGATTALYSAHPFPGRTGLKDKFSSDAWSHLIENPETPFYRFEKVAGKLSLRYATADRMRRSCVECHNAHPDSPKNDWEVGDVRGVLEVTYPIDATIRETETVLEGTLALLVGLGGMAMFTFFAVIRRLRRFAVDLNKTVTEKTTELRATLAELASHKLALDEHAIVAATDTKGTITYTNDKFCQISGYGREELIGQNHRMLNSGHHPKSFFADMYKTIANGEPWHGEIKNRTKDGSHYWVNSTIAPIKDANGKIIQYVAIRTDFTENKRAEEERLRQSQKMDVLGQLTGSVAHDFNNLLTVVDCNIGLLKSQNIDQEQQQSLIKDCLAAVELGSNLTSRLTNFARKEPLGRTKVDLNKLIVGFSDLLNRSLGGDAFCEFVLSDDPLPVLVDIVLVEVGLLNLAINARDAMPEGGMITVSLSKTIIDGEVESIYGNVEQRPYALLQVSDTGIGMAPEIKERAFEAFFTTKDEGKGTGLGLSTVGDLTQSSGGFVQIESDPGKGTTVKVYLPLYEE